jgi:hypothetical protein
MMLHLYPTKDIATEAASNIAGIAMNANLRFFFLIFSVHIVQ